MRVKLVLSFFAAWFMSIVSYATWASFADVTLINGHVVAALGVVYGLPALAASFLELRTKLAQKKAGE